MNRNVQIHTHTHKINDFCVCALTALILCRTTPATVAKKAVIASNSLQSSPLIYFISPTIFMYIFSSYARVFICNRVCVSVCTKP